MPSSSHRAHTRIRSSRRVAPLTDKHIDHEIKLVDRDCDCDRVRDGDAANLSPMKSSDPSDSQESLTRYISDPTSDDGITSIDEEPVSKGGPSRVSVIEEHNGDKAKSVEARANGHDGHIPRPKTPETAIDILYENQRGGFLCGIPLFSSAALGNLDPPAWTNYAHKPSPTNPETAQVPDPSWEWAWPEWRINHDDAIDADSEGWEYSFMFSRKFSWHGPKWYNSFVRRRAWIRRRVKANSGYQAADGQAMSPPYFNVSPKLQEPGPFGSVEELERTSTDRESRAVSRRSQDRAGGDANGLTGAMEVKTGEDLMRKLRRLRVDREKLEAVENYIRNCTDDLLPLQNCMHEIMSMFVFQASRQTLLARLTQLYDEVTGKAQKGKSTTTAKGENLAEAIKHADEEVRRLEYWSDIKGMAEEGEAVRAVDDRKGWDSGWEGLDNSGAKGVNEDHIP
ncbi:hypothetical protein GGS20DRAFT_599862 [Poronia punctata]|nr:hypothetical protein GGS20DRAFT_599862 [Poronia punctata]